MSCHGEGEECIVHCRVWIEIGSLGMPRAGRCSVEPTGLIALRTERLRAPLTMAVGDLGIAGFAFLLGEPKISQLEGLC